MKYHSGRIKKFAVQRKLERAAATVPDNMNTITAWTEYFEKEF